MPAFCVLRCSWYTRTYPSSYVFLPPWALQKLLSKLVEARGGLHATRLSTSSLSSKFNRSHRKSVPPPFRSTCTEKPQADLTPFSRNYSFACVCILETAGNSHCWSEYGWTLRRSVEASKDDLEERLVDHNQKSLECSNIRLVKQAGRDKVSLASSHFFREMIISYKTNGYKSWMVQLYDFQMQNSFQCPHPGCTQTYSQKYHLKEHFKTPCGTEDDDCTRNFRCSFSCGAKPYRTKNCWLTVTKFTRMCLVMWKLATL